jgi:ParB family chromosome partitioning protein
MKKGGLGKGLDALFADNSADSVQGSAVMLSLTEIEPNRDQPRKNFEVEALSQLADSIKQYGILQPLVVRPIPGTGTYQLVAGERRWRAARMAGLSEVPVVIKELNDSQAMEIALIENLQREDLNPIEEAEGYSMLMETFGLTQDEVAQRVGRSRPAVANALRLLNLPDDVRSMVKNGELSQGHARTLLSVPDEGQMKNIAQEIVDKGLSVRALEKLLKHNEETKKKEEKPLKLPRSPGVLAHEVGKALTERLGRKVTVKDNRDKGLIEIEFYGDDDLKHLANMLAKD